MAFSFEELTLPTLPGAWRRRHRARVSEPSQRSRDQEGPPWISEVPCANPLLSLKWGSLNPTPYTSKVATKRQCRNEVPHLTEGAGCFHGQLGVKNVPCVRTRAVVLSHPKQSCFTEESVSQGCS